MKPVIALTVEALSVVHYLPTSRIFEAEMFGRMISGEIDPTLTMPVSGLMCRINVVVKGDLCSLSFTLTKCEVWGQ